VRRPDWHLQFRLAVQAASARPFAWGDHDCCLFPARVADAITVDGDYVARLLAQFSYRSKADVTALVATGRGLRAMMNAFMPSPEIPWGWAMMGDAVLLLDEADRRVLGVCEGAQALVAAEVGVVPVPMGRALCAWRVA